MPCGETLSGRPACGRRTTLSTHGAHEQFTLKHQIVRLLVEELGFARVALEEDWAKGLQLDQYPVTGKGDPRALLADAGPPWRTEEILQLVTWLRPYNQAHPDGKVRFAGVDIVAVGPPAYDAVAEYVERAAPDHAGELEQHFAAIRPRGHIQRHLGWLHGQPDEQPLLDHARRAYDLMSPSRTPTTACPAARWPSGSMPSSSSKR